MGENRHNFRACSQAIASRSERHTDIGCLFLCLPVVLKDFLHRMKQMENKREVRLACVQKRTNE